MRAETPEHDGGDHRKRQCHKVEDNRRAGRHNDPAVLQEEGEITDEERMHEIGEIGMQAEFVQDWVKPLRITLIRKDRKTKETCGKCIE